MNKTQANAIKTLTEARRLISRPRGWIQESLSEPLYDPVKGYVKDKDGEMFYQFCAWGAVEKADGPGEQKAKSLLAKAVELITGVKKHSRYATVYNFNDKRKTRKKDVIAAFDKAIELAQAE